jgi:hypothetical protein
LLAGSARWDYWAGAKTGSKHQKQLKQLPEAANTD